MDVLLSALLIAVIVVSVLIFLLRTFGSSLMDRYLLSLHERNEEQRDKSKEEINTGVKQLLDADREKLEIIIKQLHDQLRESKDDAKSLQRQNAGITEQLKNTRTETEKLRVSTEGLKNLLSNNRLRGDWGEQVAEDLLLGSGFVENVNFLKQSITEAGRPDFTILLPDGTKLNVDAKFPLDDLIHYQEVDGAAQKRTALKKFERAVRDKIQQVTSKDYIDPEAQTVDFVVMFIPNEMVFSFIYEKLPGITEYANQKKVIMTGPFGFTAMLRLVLQAYKNFHYERGLTEILGLIEKFQGEYEKFGESLELMGRHLERAQEVFKQVETTRHSQLTRIVDKIDDYSIKQNKLTATVGEDIED